MAWVRVKEHEPIDSAIRRFKKQCEKAGILHELRKRVCCPPRFRTAQAASFPRYSFGVR